MRANIINPKIVQTGVAHLTRYVVHMLILLPVVAAILAYTIWNGLPQEAPTAVQEAAVEPVTVISAQTLAERFGMQMTLVAVTAGGGIVDVRYQVLDKEKAAYLLDDEDNPPTLFIEESGMTLRQAGRVMKHNTELENGAHYFMLYTNTQNAVRRGTPVSVVFGSLRLEPIVAQ
ncbi:MAG: hypothetical protein R3A44_43305 [Caldilineaceae bacterium]